MSPGTSRLHSARSFRVHPLPGLLRRRHQIDLVALDDPAGEVAGVVGDERLRREGLHPAQQPGIHAARGADQLVVEEVRERARCGRPADPALLLVVHGDVVVVAGLRGPVRVGLRVEGPVRHVDALHGVGERLCCRSRPARTTGARTRLASGRAPAARRSAAAAATRVAARPSPARRARARSSRRNRSAVPPCRRRTRRWPGSSGSAPRSSPPASRGRSPGRRAAPPPGRARRSPCPRRASRVWPARRCRRTRRRARP